MLAALKGLNYMDDVCGMNYHWLSDLFQCLYSTSKVRWNGSCAEAGKCEEDPKMEKGKTETARGKEYESNVRHRGEEQVVQQTWGKSQSIRHTLGRVSRFLTTHLTPLH